MQSAIQFKSQFLHSGTTISINPFLESTNSLQFFNYSSKSPIFTAAPLLSRKTQIQKPVVCAGKSRRYGSKRSVNLALELISILASNLKILPEPLDLVLQHLVAADGGLRFLNGFNGGRFYPWKRRRMRKRNGNKILGFVVVLFLGSCIVCLLLGKELRSDLLFGILGFIFFVIALSKEWKRGFKDWIFGVCCVGILLGLGLRGNEGMKWIKEIRVSSSTMEIVKRGKRRGRWAF